MKRALAFTLMVLAIMIIAVSCEEPHVHGFEPEWSYDDTHHWHKATCGHEEVSEKGEHVWKEGGDENGWITEKAATETEKGSAYRICTVCGYKGTKDIQKLSHVHTYSSYSSNSDKHWRTCTSCGETFTYTHTFSTYVDGGTGGHYPKCNCGYKKTTIEAHVYTGTQKYMSEAVYDICDKCAHQKEKESVDTTTGVATAGAETEVTAKDYKTETVKVATADGKTVTKTVEVNRTDVDITVASSAVKTATTTDDANEGKTKVTFPAGALKVEDGAKSVSLIVESAPAAVASNAT